jgi:hypothetical protein
MRIARNSVYHDREHASYLELPVVASAGPRPSTASRARVR